MSATTDTQEKLRAARLFAEFTSEELENLIDLVETQRIDAGECVVRQDEAGDAMFVIVAGKVKVVHRKGAQKIELATLGCGDFFGEISLVDEGPRSADVEAVSDCTLLRITAGSLRALAGVYPSAGFKILIAIGRVMVERMRGANQKYIDSLLVGQA